MYKISQNYIVEKTPLSGGARAVVSPYEEPLIQGSSPSPSSSSPPSPSVSSSHRHHHHHHRHISMAINKTTIIIIALLIFCRYVGCPHIMTLCFLFCSFLYLISGISTQTLFYFALFFTVNKCCTIPATFPSIPYGKDEMKAWVSS